MNNLVTIVVTQRESFHLTRESLRSLRDSVGASVSILYVDGGSPPDCRDFLAAQQGPRFRHLRSEQFLSPNEARQCALSLVETPFVAFVDNDVLFHPGWLDCLLETAVAQDAAAVAPFYRERIGAADQIHMAGGEVRIEERAGRRCLIVTHDQRKAHGELANTIPFRTDHVEYHGLLVRTDCLRRRPDLFDPLIPSIPENVDFCLGIQALGGTIWMDPRAVVTILLPEQVADADRAFYRTRWSQDWQQLGLARFREKWDLSGRQPVLESQLRWAVAHRVVARRVSLHRLLGVPSDSILNRRLLAPFEHRCLGA